jgi:hypothetical protein
METKYRVFRFKPVEGRAGVTPTRQSRVIALPEGFPKPAGAEEVAAEVPLSEWVDVPAESGEEN